MFKINENVVKNNSVKKTAKFIGISALAFLTTAAPLASTALNAATSTTPVVTDITKETIDAFSKEEVKSSEDFVNFLVSKVPTNNAGRPNVLKLVADIKAGNVKGSVLDVAKAVYKAILGFDLNDASLAKNLNGLVSDFTKAPVQVPPVPQPKPDTAAIEASQKLTGKTVEELDALKLAESQKQTGTTQSVVQQPVTHEVKLQVINTKVEANSKPTTQTVTSTEDPKDSEKAVAEAAAQTRANAERGNADIAARHQFLVSQIAEIKTEVATAKEDAQKLEGEIARNSAPVKGTAPAGLSADAAKRAAEAAVLKTATDKSVAASKNVPATLNADFSKRVTDAKALETAAKAQETKDAEMAAKAAAEQTKANAERGASTAAGSASAAQKAAQAEAVAQKAAAEAAPEKQAALKTLSNANHQARLLAQQLVDLEGKLALATSDVAKADLTAKIKDVQDQIAKQNDVVKEAQTNVQKLVEPAKYADNLAAEQKIIDEQLATYKTMNGMKSDSVKSYADSHPLFKAYLNGKVVVEGQFGNSSYGLNSRVARAAHVNTGSVKVVKTRTGYSLQGLKAAKGYKITSLSFWKGRNGSFGFNVKTARIVTLSVKAHFGKHSKVVGKGEFAVGAKTRTSARGYHFHGTAQVATKRVHGRTVTYIRGLSADRHYKITKVTISNYKGNKFVNVYTRHR